MKEEIKQTLLNGIENGEFTSSFSDDLFDNLDQVAEYLAKQDILINREVVLINKHYSGETKMSTDTYYACKLSDIKDSIKKVMATKDRYKKELSDSKAYIELQKEEIARQIRRHKDYRVKGFLLGVLFSAILTGVICLNIYLFELFTK